MQYLPSIEQGPAVWTYRQVKQVPKLSPCAGLYPAIDAEEELKLLASIQQRWEEMHAGLKRSNVQDQVKVQELYASVQTRLLEIHFKAEH